MIPVRGANPAPNDANLDPWPIVWKAITTIALEWFHDTMVVEFTI